MLTKFLLGLIKGLLYTADTWCQMLPRNWGKIVHFLNERLIKHAIFVYIMLRQVEIVLNLLKTYKMGSNNFFYLN